MTNAEALQSVLDVNIEYRNENTIEKALLDQGLNKDDQYSLNNRKSVDLAAAALILTLCTSSDYSEGDFKITQADRKVLLSIRSAILTSYAMPDNYRRNIITDKSRSW